MDASKWTQANTLKGVDSIIFPISWEKSVFPNSETSLSRLRRIEKLQLFAKFLNIFPPQVGEKPASPILELLYYSFAELGNRTNGENLQLNIVLFQGSLFNGLLIFASPKWASVSIIISKFERKY